MTLPHHPNAEAEAGVEPAHAHHVEGEGAGAEREATRARTRLPFAHVSAASMVKWKRETRFGIAALLSFVILVSVLIMNKKKGATAAEKRSGEKPPVLALGGPPADPSKDPAPPPAEDKGRAKDETPPKPEASNLPPAPDAAPAAKSEPTPPPAENVKLTATDSESVALPMPDPAAEKPPAPAPTEPLPGAAPEPTPVPDPPAQAPTASKSTDTMPVPEPAGPPAKDATPSPAPESPPPTPAPGTPSGNEPLLPPEAQPRDSGGTLPQPETLPQGPAQPASTAVPDVPPAPEASNPKPEEPPATSPGGGLPPIGSAGVSIPQERGQGPTQEMAAPASRPNELPMPQEAVAAQPPASAKATELPNLSPSPGAAEMIAPKPTEDRSGPANWVAIPNVGKSQFLEDESTPRESPVIGPAEKPATPRTDFEDRVEPVPHVVASGENFWTISRLYYGSGRYYKALWKANSSIVAAPAKLVVGTTIKIPPPEALDRTLIEPPPTQRPASTGTGSAKHRTSRPIPKGERSETTIRRPSEIELALPIVDPFSDRASKEPADEDASDTASDASEDRTRPGRPIYKVRAHETLRSIARDTLGDSRRYREILEINKDVLDDPTELAPGQILELPDDARLGRRTH